MKLVLVAMGVAVWAVPRIALAEPPKEAQYDEGALKAALDEAPGAAGKRAEKAGSALDVPPPPPRKSGLVLEGSLGAMGFLGKLNTVSPSASNLHLQLGFEPFRWFMVFGEGDLSFTSTRYSPPSRGYAIYAFGGGGRLTVGLSERVSLYGQADFGLTAVKGDVLHSYGFYEAQNLNIYIGATGGLEWYQADPHYALGIYGGVRTTQGFQRTLLGDNGLAWRGGVAIRYAF